jgi:hypothetical protein
LWGLQTGMKGWFLLLVYGPCISKPVWNLFGLPIINSIRDSIYWRGKGNISSFLNKPLQDALGAATDIIPITLFLEFENLTTISCVAPKYNSIYDDWMKVSNVTEVWH